jgi:hypothetical protein
MPGLSRRGFGLGGAGARGMMTAKDEAVSECE